MIKQHRNKLNQILTKYFQPNSYQKYTYLKVYSLLLTVIIIVVIIILRQAGAFQNLALIAYDWFVRLATQEIEEDKLLLVEITDTDILNQNKWPLSDQTLAQLISNLQQYQPAVIGLDIYRDIAHPPGTFSLQQELQAANVISIQYLGDGTNQVIAPQGVSPQQIGFNDVVLDVDNKLRRNLMYARVGDHELYSFALRLSLAYLQKNSPVEADFNFKVTDQYLHLGDTSLKRLQANAGGYQMEASEALGWQILINYQSSYKIPKVNLTDVLAGNIDPNLVKNKVVIIGTTAPSINDFFFTPYGGQQTEIAGVVAHAQMVSQIIALASDESRQVWFFPEAVEYVWIGIWSITLVAIALYLDNPLKIMLLGILGIIILGQICWLSFLLGGWIPFVPTVLGVVITLGGLLLQRIIYNYFYDSLTGLPNRTLFLKQLEQLQQQHLQRKQTGVIMVQCIDLDRFKMINDALGYQAGDFLLITTAKRLKTSLGEKTMIARVGGDEFAIAQLIADKTLALNTVNQLQKQLNVPLDLAGLKTSTAITTGIAIHESQNKFNPENILRSARTAMYQAKASGKISHQVFATKMHEQALKRLQLEADLYEAIKKQEFELYYQPIIDLTTEKIAGFEALIRWISPQRGFVSPGAFIPVAEETGAIIPLGEWILQQACQEMFQLQQKFPELTDAFISVNLSGKQFSQNNLVEMIQNTLKLSGLKSSSLKLEITESMVMENVNQAIAILDKLKALGIKLSMDDFGTGFSSFSYLHRFPMDTLKVDRSFVSNMNQSKKNFEIVSTIVLLAHKLGMDIVAEGIETEEEKIALKGLNCQYGQGYLFAKPLPIGEVASLFI